MNSPTDLRDPYEWMRRSREGFDPLIITVAVNGGIQGRESHPALPETPEEIANAVGRAYDAGASAVHIHGRNPEWLPGPAIKPETYAEINHLVRERCPEIIINNTTGGGPGITMDERLDCLRAAPEIASLNMGPDMIKMQIPARPSPLPHPHEGYLYDDCVPYTYGFIERLAGQMKAFGVKPEMEIYHPGQFWVSRSLIEQGLIEAPYVHQFVMGYQTSSFATPQNLLDLVRDLPNGSVFFVCGIGPSQLPMTTLSTILGGHVRVGLEDNLYFRRGEKLTDNAAAVERAVGLAQLTNREVASPAEARALLGLSSEPRVFGDSLQVSA